MPKLSAIIIPILAMFLFQVAYSQPGSPQTTKFSVYKDLSYPVFQVDDSVNVAPNPNLSVQEHYGYPPGAYPIRAACKINDKTELQICEAHLKNDTLVIRIVHKSPTSFYELEVTVAEKSFSTLYSFTIPESAAPFEVYPTDQLLVLSKSRFSAGDEIRGFINFRGTGRMEPESFREWDSKEDYVPSDYVIRGPFRAVIH